MSDTRIVLIKPGDVLLLGNLGPLTAADADHLHASLGELRARLGLAGVALFEGDVDLGVMAASDLTTGLSTSGCHME